MMLNTRKPASLWEEIETKRQAKIKEIKRAKFRLKARIFLTMILPVFVVLLSVKVIQTFLRVKVREIFAKPVPETQAEAKKAAPVKARMTPVTKEIITPEPVTEIHE